VIYLSTTETIYLFIGNKRRFILHLNRCCYKWWTFC